MGNQKNEIWVNIPQYPSYQISNYVQIKSLSKTVNSKNGSKRITKEKILKLNKRSDGYITIQFGKKCQPLYVHRLMAIIFIPNPLNKPCVNHKDGNKQNNNINNLEWVTYSENERHSMNVLGKKRKKINEHRDLEIAKSFFINNKTKKELSIIYKITTQRISNVIKKYKHNLQ
jgi:hypothetical protein